MPVRVGISGTYLPGESLGDGESTWWCVPAVWSSAFGEKADFRSQRVVLRRRRRWTGGNAAQNKCDLFSPFRPCQCMPFLVTHSARAVGVQPAHHTVPRGAKGIQLECSLTSIMKYARNSAVLLTFA